MIYALLYTCCALSTVIDHQLLSVHHTEFRVIATAQSFLFDALAFDVVVSFEGVAGILLALVVIHR